MMVICGFMEIMRPLTISHASDMILGLQDEIQRSKESRYHHRLHGVLLVAQGLTCPEVAQLLGDAPRTVEYWVRGFEERGLAALAEGERSGRPSRLSSQQREAVEQALRQAPREVGLSGNVWDGKALSAWIEQSFDITLGVRQCQRMFRQLEFRLRKPRPVIAQAKPERRAAFKKTPRSGPRPRGRSVGRR
jgi:transposase